MSSVRDREVPGASRATIYELASGLLEGLPGWGDETNADRARSFFVVWARCRTPDDGGATVSAPS